ncbi:MAG TPA: M36 family metallopeptidase [Pyrinomonadaceae bacterium]|nr:M36 family metallopeptidase [Pyrinomonadaceae bacterium]
MRSSRRKKFSLLLAFALVLPALALPAGSGGASAQGGGAGRQKQKSFGYKPETVSVRAPGAARHLTGPNSGKPFDIALGHLKQSRHKLGVDEADLEELKVTDEYKSGHNGVTHIYLRQQLGGIEVVGAEASTNVARDGSVINLHSSFVKGLRGAANRRAPALSPIEAVEAAARHLELTLTEPLNVLEAEGGPARRTAFSRGGISLDPIGVRLVFQPVGESSVRLAWSVEIHQTDGQHAWDIRVDAENGDVLAGDDLVDHDNWGEGFAPDAARNRNLAVLAAAARPAPVASTALPTAGDGSAYNVSAYPFESPSDGGRTLVTNPADVLASPFGWHDANGAAGPEFTRTRGNNVHAYTDLNGDNIADAGSDPDGGPALQFDFPFNQSDGPASYRPAAVTNLFYWNNLVHDVFYRYGFDEMSGNFQLNNYGRGPVVAPLGDNDDVRAEAQDGAGTNNANFFTPVDGQRPRMQMFVWTNPLPNLAAVNVHTPSPIAGEYRASHATFGPLLTGAGITAPVVVALDSDIGIGPSPNDACTLITNATEVSGKIALVERGSCAFAQKVSNLEVAGAVAVIVTNNVAGDTAVMGNTVPITFNIPSVMVTLEHGNLLRANLPLTATLSADQHLINRDSDFDAGVIAHEYGHGISNRLTGGRNVVTCLNNAEQMGEGWSDFFGLVLTTDPTDTPTTPRGVGTYVHFEPPDGPGSRPTRYTTDFNVNHSTYLSLTDTANISQPHGVGYVWATMLWEMYWNLVEEHGYNPNVYDSWQTGGNNLAIQLVMDGMKLQPCRPGFVDARNAILQADVQLTGGENECLIWDAFARRGLGFSASQGSNLSRVDGTAAFDLPPACRATFNLAPPSLAQSLTPNAQAAQTLTISNGNKQHGEDLFWGFLEAPNDCESPASISDVPWLSVSPATGTTEGGGLSSVNVAFDSTGLGVGVYTAKLCISSNGHGSPSTTVPVTLDVNYDFGGFHSPVANAPALNTVEAGQTVPLHFSLNGSFGLDILAAGSPASRQVDCMTLAPLGAFELAETPGGSGLSASADRYNYPWKTGKPWGGTCRELVVRTNDNTDHNAFFSFR